MQTARLILLVLAILVFIMGGVMTLPAEREAGQFLILGSAIIIAGILISHALAEKNK